jgi:hypothetical protein
MNLAVIGTYLHMNQCLISFCSQQMQKGSRKTAERNFHDPETVAYRPTGSKCDKAL